MDKYEKQFIKWQEWALPTTHTLNSQASMHNAMVDSIATLLASGLMLLMGQGVIALLALIGFLFAWISTFAGGLSVQRGARILQDILNVEGYQAQYALWTTYGAYTPWTDMSNHLARLFTINALVLYVLSTP